MIKYTQQNLSTYFLFSQQFITAFSNFKVHAAWKAKNLAL